MQYQIQLIRQHLRSIDYKFQPIRSLSPKPAFVITRQLFACRSLSPSYIKVRSKSFVTTQYSSQTRTISSQQKDQYTSQVSTKPILPLTKVNGTHSQIVTQSQENFYQKKSIHIQENETKEIDKIIIPKVEESKQQNQNQQKMHLNLVCLKNSSQLNYIKNDEQQETIITRKQETSQEQIQKQYNSEIIEKRDYSIQSQDVHNELQHSNEQPQVETQNDFLKNDEFQIVDVVQNQTNSNFNESSSLQLHSCNKTPFYKKQQKYSTLHLSRKGTTRYSTRIKSPQVNSGKKQHVIYYNQIYLYKPRDSKHNTTIKSGGLSPRDIKDIERFSGKKVSYILTSPGKKTQISQIKKIDNQDDVEVINFAPEFSRLI